MKKMIALFAGIFSVGAVAADYSVGQIWEYQTRPNEERSHLYIVRIDSQDKLSNIYHIYVDGVLIKNPHIDGGIQKQLPHAPVNEKTLKNSLIKLVGSTTDLPDISEGYAVWKEAFELTI